MGQLQENRYSFPCCPPHSLFMNTGYLCSIFITFLTFILLIIPISIELNLRKSVCATAHWNFCTKFWFFVLRSPENVTVVLYSHWPTTITKLVEWKAFCNQFIPLKDMKGVPPPRTKFKNPLFLRSYPSV